MASNENNNQAKIAQLSELNSRARAYTTRLWQIPFAFITLTGLLNATLLEKSKIALLVSLIFSTIFGILVFLNMLGMLERLNKAIDAINKLEEHIGLEQTAARAHCLNIYPLFIVIGLVTLIYLCSLILIFCCCRFY